jgi:hypothetical protein
MNQSLLKRKSFLIPTLIWLGLIVIYLVALGSDYRKHDSLSRTLIQWDGRLYLSIAEEGYTKFPCPDRPQYICGNGGWFPFYPMLATGFVALGVPASWAMLGVSWLALWLALLVLYRLIQRRFDDRIATGSLLALLLWPGTFYFLTAFPYSVFLLLAAIVFWLLDSGRYRWLWLPAGLLTVTYPSGALIGLPIAWVLFSRWRSIPQPDRIRLIGAMVAVPVAIVIYFSYYWWRFGDFWLYVQIQSQPWYSHEPAFPLWTMVQSLIHLPTGHPVNLTVLFAALTVLVFFSRRLPVSWYLFAFGVLLFTPAMGTTDCYYRHIVVAFPMFVLLGAALRDRMRRYLLVAWAVAAVALEWFVLLPAYKAGMLM